MGETLAVEYFDSLWEIYVTGDITLSARYKRMRGLLERLCHTLMENESLQMTDLAARITYLSSKYGLDNAEQNRLHTFRLTANDILNQRREPDEPIFLRDLKTLAFTIRKLLGHDIPYQLYSVLPKHTVVIPERISKQEKIKRLRTCFQYADDTFLYVTPLDIISDELLKVRYNVKGINDEFNETINHLWQYAQLNLLDITVDENNIHTPAFIVLEPDYMIDISSLAECYKDYGSHPANYVLSKIVPISNARPLLMGNIANLFLDEWIHAGKDLDYLACMKNVFKKYSVELAACEELQDREKEQQFFADCRMHFDHIHDVVQNTFKAPGYNLDKEDAVLEPSYICEALGLQGRLDYMQRDMSSFIEMKSGRADEYAIKGKIEPKENNRVQMLLYMAVLEYSMGKSHKEQHPYLLYTRYPLLYPARASWALVKRAINVRNRIVVNEYNIQKNNSISYTKQILEKITPQLLNEKHLRGRFWEQYLCPSIETFINNFTKLNLLEQNYYLALYNFVTKEQYLSKSGDISYDGRRGSASLWLSTLEEKCEAGEILYNLRITDNHASDEHKAYVTLSIPEYGDEFLPNFRTGDVVVLYERNNENDKATNKLVFKGSIEYISPYEIKIRMRATQQNISVLPETSFYAVEHDTMDTGFKCMYQALHTFSVANKDRRDILLSQREPVFEKSYEAAIQTAEDDFTRVALKAKAAKDYFLLVGPPGTGKTSRALKKMVEMFFAEEDTQLLLLAYTNRAVDEVCKAILSIAPQIDFIRIGSELSCEESYREYLIENRISGCSRRSEVSGLIKGCRVFVGTVASIANKPELFKLKSFDVAIVDEATQILEPQLLGILTAKDTHGKNAVGKFILIGDHKQLPAVVLQSREESAVKDEHLNAISLYNLSDSLFERLYRKHQDSAESWAVDMLYKQGRMNPEVGFFANEAFYNGKLIPVGLPHQSGDIPAPAGWESEMWSKLITSRISFIPSLPHKNSSTGKINKYEAQIVARIAYHVYQYYKEEFDPNHTLGIITPYRSQIAMIKKELSFLSIPSLNEITVDTVERYQGSEREVIIYSFSVNYKWQLKQLVNILDDNGVLVDRKLNVALTRARKQLIITGVQELLYQDPIYAKLLKWIENKGGFTVLCNS